MNPRALSLICLLTPAIAAALPGLESEEMQTTAASDAGETPTIPATNFADDRFYLAPFGTFIQPGGARNANAGWGGGLGFGKILNQFFNVEVRGFWQGFDSRGYPHYSQAFKGLSAAEGVAEQLVAFPASKEIEVAGYASDEGKRDREPHNLALSQRRSESVAQYLRDKGVNNPLFAKGYGTEYPVADNATEAGRQQNRRVELRWQQD
jgi:hypothetical protein